jgi:hypothetical protein
MYSRTLKGRNPVLLTPFFTLNGGARKNALEFRGARVLRLRQYCAPRKEYLFGNSEVSCGIAGLFLLIVIAIHLHEFCNQLTVY